MASKQFVVRRVLANEGVAAPAVDVWKSRIYSQRRKKERREKGGMKCKNPYLNRKVYFFLDPSRRNHLQRQEERKVGALSKHGISFIWWPKFWQWLLSHIEQLSLQNVKQCTVSRREFLNIVKQQPSLYTYLLLVRMNVRYNLKA